jgi:hypothetical protein
MGKVFPQASDIEDEINKKIILTSSGYGDYSMSDTETEKKLKSGSSYIILAALILVLVVFCWKM